MKKKKILFMLVLILSVFSLMINVYAEDDPCIYARSGDCTSLISNYNSGKTQNIKVTSGSIQKVTVYGKSICSTDSKTCKFDYSGFSSYLQLLKSKVVCSSGEKYIKVSDAESAATDYTSETNSGNKNETAYFSEKYNVTCTGEAVSGANELSNTSNTTVTNDSSTSTDTTVTNSGSGVENAGSGVTNSGSAVENPGTGVETYYIVLGVTAICAYLITVKVKKHNLFKNI